MADEMKRLLDNDVLSNEVKDSILETWNNKVSELREEIAAEIRDEFATRVEKDKSEIVEAMNLMMQDILTPVLEDVAKEKQAAIEEQVKLKIAIRENTEAFDAFCKKVLEEEVAEFRQDRKVANESLLKVNDFINGQVEAVLEDFHNEKRQLVEERVTLKAEMAAKLAEAKTKMIKKQARKASKFVENTLAEELNQLKDELNEARKNNFGRRLFESFYAEFSTGFFNENKEVNKLLDAIKEREEKLNEAKKELEYAESKLNESRIKVRTAEEKLERTNIMNELLSPLSGEKRVIMEEMLSKHSNQKLHENFERYLPAVLGDTTSNKSRSLYEGNLKEVTGNRHNIITETNNEQQKQIMSDFINNTKKLIKN